MTTNEKRKKKSPIILTEDEKCAIYNYCAEHHYIIQNGPSFKFRMFKSAVLEDINGTDLLTRKINDYHLGSAIAEVIGWQSRLGIEVNFKETAEVQQIKEQHIVDVKIIEALKLQVNDLKMKLADINTSEDNINDYKQRMAQIRKLASI